MDAQCDRRWNVDGPTAATPPHLATSTEELQDIRSIFFTLCAADIARAVIVTC